MINRSSGLYSQRIIIQRDSRRISFIFIFTTTAQVMRIHFYCYDYSTRYAYTHFYCYDYSTGYYAYTLLLLRLQHRLLCIYTILPLRLYSTGYMHIYIHFYFYDYSAGYTYLYIYFYDYSAGYAYRTFIFTTTAQAMRIHTFISTTKAQAMRIELLFLRLQHRLCI